MTLPATTSTIDDAPSDWAKSEDPLLVTAARFAALPTFDAAVQEYVKRALNLRRGPYLVNKLVSYEKRWRLVAYLLYLALDNERFGPTGGATYKRLLEFCATSPSISPRVLKTVLALLQVSGFVTTVRSKADARSKLYRPTAQLLGFADDWMSYAVHTLDILELDEQYVEAFRRNPSFATRFFISAGRERLTSTPLISRMPKYVAFFGRKEGASAVLMTLLQSKFDSAAIPSRAAIATRFSMSKTQVNTILAEAESEGLIRFEDDIPRPTPLFIEAQRRWIAVELAFYARNMPLAEPSGHAV